MKQGRTIAISMPLSATTTRLSAAGPSSHSTSRHNQNSAAAFSCDMKSNCQHTPLTHLPLALLHLPSGPYANYLALLMPSSPASGLFAEYCRPDSRTASLKCCGNLLRAALTSSALGIASACPSSDSASESSSELKAGILAKEDAAGICFLSSCSPSAAHISAQVKQEADVLPGYGV